MLMASQLSPKSTAGRAWHLSCHCTLAVWRAAVKIRDALNIHHTWPPAWTSMGRDRKLLEGEVGVLADAYSNDVAESAIFVVIRVCADKFIGVIFLNDQSCGSQILSLLQANIGRPIQEIGDLEL
jgi:hypothetical protein